MVKRKEISGKASQNGSVDSDSDAELLDIEFEWFDPQEVDFHGIKQLFKQLFDADNEMFDISSLSDLVISQPALGSMVKVADDENEAKDNDPFAFLTVLNLHTHRERNDVRRLAAYLATKAELSPGLSSTPLSSLLQDSSPEVQIGLVLTERFINMPAEIVPPMYRMLVEEISDAVKESKPYSFTHYLILSKAYTEVSSTLSDIQDDEQHPAKKKKGKGAKGNTSRNETFFFHPEDEVWMRHASAKGEFAYSKEPDPGSSDAKRAFQEAGIKPLGLMMLIEARQFDQAVKDIEMYIGGAPLPT